MSRMGVCPTVLRQRARSQQWHHAYLMEICLLISTRASSPYLRIQWSTFPSDFARVPREP